MARKTMRERLAVGVDVGATLAKVARCSLDHPAATRFDLLLSSDLAQLASHVAELEPAKLGITGGGATGLAALLEREARHVSEFDAWAAGARRLLADGGRTLIAPDEGFLVVSLGTGTSVLCVSATSAVRVGGTALGGGTIVGLGAALTGASFADLCRLADEGSAAAVDLRVSDIYGHGEILLAGDLTAANFGKFARRASVPGSGDPIAATKPADLAAGVMQLVGENVALICAGLAAATQSKKIVYGGSSVRHNPRLVEVLRQVTTMCGRDPHFPADGEFAGALGALALAREAV